MTKWDFLIVAPRLDADTSQWVGFSAHIQTLAAHIRVTSL